MGIFIVAKHNIFKNILHHDSRIATDIFYSYKIRNKLSAISISLSLCSMMILTLVTVSWIGDLQIICLVGFNAI